MKILIACGAMPFGPNTLNTKSLGGSETAALMLGKELAKRGHNVQMFCNLPPQGAVDFWQSGKKHTDGVTYVDLSAYRDVCMSVSVDLHITVRDPNIAAQFVDAKKKVLWMHDIATKRGMQVAFDQMGFIIDEVWTVSEWHRQQVHEATGYPLENIVALRNGIVPVETLPTSRMKKQLVYAARPERGLLNLIEPGGIMEHLPDYNLVVCMYDHFPEHMKDFYQYVFALMEKAPNVQFLGPKSQQELRQIIRDSAAYVYPTQFEETSCILARECIEQGTPFLTTRVGALPETLGSCGTFFEDWEAHVFMGATLGLTPGATPWRRQFAHFVREVLEKRGFPEIHAMTSRTDLYWDGVAELVEKHAEPKPVKPFSLAWSLIQDGDVIAAKHYLDHLGEAENDPVNSLREEIWENYPFLLKKDDPRYKSLPEYYEWVYAHKKDRDDTELVYMDDVRSQRVDAVAEELTKLAPGSKVMEYGCGPGHLLAALAKRFPLLDFVGFDVSESAIKVLNDGAAKAGAKNIAAFVCGDMVLPEQFDGFEFDAAIVSEVLEHVLEPWTTLEFIERYVRVDGRVVATCPYGPWEIGTIRHVGKWHERAHIWSIDAETFREMLGHKKEFRMMALPKMMMPEGRLLGNILCAYSVSPGRAVGQINVEAKIKRHHARQSCVACVIAMNNEDTILKMLNSIQHEVQWVNIAHGPSTDNTWAVVEDWFERHPWIGHTWIDVPAIEPYKFGFDHARKASTQGMEQFDWMLWIDTDEYLSGSFRKYLRNNHLQGLVLCQHHFTVEPRGIPAQIDRPARLLRTDAGYEVRGHIHEHFEQPDGGIGRCYMLNDVDLGHTGYENEEVRKRRFYRNFAFLEWDHKEPGPKRQLHHFLWFRDIVHRMRVVLSEGRRAEALALAREGKTYYNTHWKSMLTFGHGLQMGLAYLAEINKLLNVGMPMKVQIQIEDKVAGVEGSFEDYAQAEDVLRALLDAEFKERSHRYW